MILFGRGNIMKTFTRYIFQDLLFITHTNYDIFSNEKQWNETGKYQYWYTNQLLSYFKEKRYIHIYYYYYDKYNNYDKNNSILFDFLQILVIGNFEYIVIYTLHVQIFNHTLVCHPP